MDDQFGSPLSTKFLHASLSTRQIGRPIIYYKSVSSTNAVGFHAAELGTSHGTVILADHQTAGKGRLGRAWHSPERKNLYFSIVLTQAPSKALISWIPLLTGVALAETLESESTAPIVLKWPNDILCCEKKLGGILCEGRPKEKGNSVCVVGIGININSDKGDFPSDLYQSATSLAIESAVQHDRHMILQTFLEKFESHYDQLLLTGIHDLRFQYILRCHTLKKSIRVQCVSGQQLEGIAVNIGNDGSLEVMPSQNREMESMISIRSGDVFHLR